MSACINIFYVCILFFIDKGEEDYSILTLGTQADLLNLRTDLKAQKPGSIVPRQTFLENCYGKILSVHYLLE